MSHFVWKKQPETPEELEQAFTAFDACCLGCYRYAGNDPAIMQRVGQACCDQAPMQTRAISKLEHTFARFASRFKRP